MNATYEKKKAMTFIGYHTEIRPDEGYVKCPEFWEKEYNQKYARLWQTMEPETPVEKAILENHIGMFAICAESENGFDYWIAGLYQGGEVPNGLELYAFPESSWAVFSAKGPMPEALQTLNTYVWQEWFPKRTEGAGKRYGDARSVLRMRSAVTRLRMRYLGAGERNRYIKSERIKYGV